MLRKSVATFLGFAFLVISANSIWAKGPYGGGQSQTAGRGQMTRERIYQDPANSSSIQQKSQDRQRLRTPGSNINCPQPAATSTPTNK